MSESRFTAASAAPRIESLLRKLIADAGFDLDFKIGPSHNPHPDFENPEVVVRFSGEDVDLLLANKAELLLAMETLVMEMLRMTADEHSLLQFDANDYRMMRIEELRLSALTAAERVKKSRTPFFFNPMNSRERRIIHLALRNEADVRSESAGMGPQRAVVVYPAGMPSLPASALPQPVFRRPSSGGRPGGGRGDRDRGDRRDRRDRGDRRRR